MTNTSLFMKAIIDLFIMRKPSGIIQIDVNQLIRNILNLGITKQEWIDCLIQNEAFKS